MSTPPADQQTKPPDTDTKSQQTQDADRRVWRNVLSLVGGNAVGEVLGIVVHTQMLGILGPGGFGRYAQVVALTDVSNGVASFGMGEVGPVLGVKHAHGDGIGAYLGTLLALRLCVAAVVIVAVLSLRGWLVSSPFGLVALALLSLPLGALGNTATVPFFIHQENIRIAWVPGASAVLQMLALLAVLWWAPSLWWVVLVMMLGQAFNAIVVSETARRRYKFRYSFSKPILKELLTVGPRAAWLSTVVIIYSRASYFVLNGLGAVMLGLYGLADRITSPLLRVTGALSASSLPMFAQLARDGDRAAIWGFYLRNARRIALGLAALAPLIYLLAPWIIRAFFPAYADSIPVLYVLFVCIGIMSYCQLTSSCLNGLGHFGWVASVATINLAVYSLFAWLLVPELQAVGAALATGLMETINLCMQLFLMSRALKSLSTPPQSPTQSPPTLQEV